MSGLHHPLTLTAHFCPDCGEQCSCQDATVYDGVDEDIVEDCTHQCPQPDDVDRIDGLDDGAMGSIDAEYATTRDAPATWARPEGFTGPCPDCGSTTCPGYYKPDGTHRLPI